MENDAAVILLGKVALNNYKEVVSNFIQPELFRPWATVDSTPHINEINTTPSPINLANGPHNQSSSLLSEKQELSGKASSMPIVIIPTSHHPTPIQLLPSLSVCSVAGTSSNGIQQSDLSDVMHSGEKEDQGKSIAQADIENRKEAPKSHYTSFDATMDTMADTKENNSIDQKVLSGKTVYPWHSLLPFLTTITNGKAPITISNLPHSLTGNVICASFGNKDNINQKANEGHGFHHNGNGGECKCDNGNSFPKKILGDQVMVAKEIKLPE